MSLVARLRQMFANTLTRRSGTRDARRRSDPPFGGLRSRDVADLPPERAAELAGHAQERVDT